MHACHVPSEFPGLATAAATGLTGLLWWRRWARSGHPVLHPLEAAGVTGAIGGWVTAATTWGPLTRPDDILTWTYAGAAAGGYWWLRTHEAVRAARQRRDDHAADLADRQLWHQILPRVGLGGWHLQETWETNLGEERLIITSPDNAPATQLAAHDSVICEKLAHILDLPYGRIDLRLTGQPGQLIIGIRYVDMAVRDAAYHPMTDPWPDGEPSPFTNWFPEQASIIGPKAWGFTPEDGTEQAVTLINERGGKCVGIIGMTDSGKSNILNGFRETITRCSNARLVQFNGAHMGDELVWEPLSALTLCGSVRDDPDLRLKIAAALESLCVYVTNRTATLAETGHSTFQVTDDDPALGIIIDEVDEIVKYVPGAGDALEFLAGKQRKAAIFLILATQRAVIAALGGGGVRANMSEVLVGLTARQSESRHATGAEVEIPDIREYSRGAVGYFQRFDPRSGQVTGRGRAFLLGVPPNELAYCQRLVETRRHLRDWTIRDLPEVVFEDGTAGDDDAMGRIADLRSRLESTRQANQPDSPEAAVPPRVAAPQLRLLIPGVPAHHAARIISLLKTGPMSAPAIGLALGVDRRVAHEYLKAIRAKGLVELDNRGRASAWRFTGPLDPPAETAPDGEESPRHGYVTVQALAEAAHNGLLDDLDDDARDVLEQVWALTGGNAQ
jgi:hypothetical protein